ncbi:MAG: hypothetical protein ACLUCR_05845, partial [Limosilactobacillus fermentum]
RQFITSLKERVSLPAFKKGPREKTFFSQPLTGFINIGRKVTSDLSLGTVFFEGHFPLPSDFQMRSN